MKYAKIFLAFALVLACDSKVPTEPNGGTQLPQWPMFGGNLRNSANTADSFEYYSGPEAGEIVWTWDTNEVFWCSPSIGPDGTIYIATSPSLFLGADSGFVYALNPDGSLKWRFRTQKGNLSTGAVGQDGTYFYGSLDQYFYAINRDGKLKWKRLFAGATFETEARPAITKTGEVIVAVGAGVTALDEETGDLIWFYEKDMDAGFSVSIDRQGNIYTGTRNSVLALTPTGSLEWEYGISFGPREVMVGNDGVLYFHGLRDSLFYALGPDGNLKWTFNIRGMTENSSPAMGPDGSIYTAGPGHLFKLDSEGNVEWEIAIRNLLGMGGNVRNSRLIIDKNSTIYMLILATGEGNLWAIDQRPGVKWSVLIEDPFSFIFPTPAIDTDGTLYIAGDHSLNAIR